MLANKISEYLFDPFDLAVDESITLQVLLVRAFHVDGARLLIAPPRVSSSGPLGLHCTARVPRDPKVRVMLGSCTRENGTIELELSADPIGFVVPAGAVLELELRSTRQRLVQLRCLFFAGLA